MNLSLRESSSLHRYLHIIALFFLPVLYANAQKIPTGIVTGQVLDSTGKKAVTAATIQLMSLSDSTRRYTLFTDKQGSFIFEGIALDYYRMSISAVGYRTKLIDSLYIRAERFDFNLGDIFLDQRITEVAEIVIYAEKPLIESKEGNITFNVAESAISAGSNASELLKNTPLVTTDPNGKIMVRGKEPRILIDDKPVELNAQQLQDLLEAMPGSNIEKIEVLTNPPPQYANEQGGVINIVTRKGKIGFGTRVNIYAGTRGELGSSVNVNYRKQGLAINFNAGAARNIFENEGYSYRTNIFRDSANQLLTNSNGHNVNTRPNLRLNIDYDINKFNTLSITANYHRNQFDNHGINAFTNVNRYNEVWRRSERDIKTNGDNENLNAQLSYTHKGKKQGRKLRLMAGANTGANDNDRLFFQQFLTPLGAPTGVDSTQRQVTFTRNHGYNFQLHYDHVLVPGKTTFSSGAAYTRSSSDVNLITAFWKKPEGKFDTIAFLSNNLLFHQDVISARLSLKHVIREGFSVSAGTAVEQTNIFFELLKDNHNIYHRYYNWLPFANVNRSWKNKIQLTFSYRKTIRRPGMGEMNPAIDYSDPYNLRLGNPYLSPSTAHNFDLVLGKTKEKFHVNAGLGYNSLSNIFSQLRSLQPDGVTILTWDNVSGRKEYEASTWGGITLSRLLRLNLSASYVHNVYSIYDKTVRKFRDGGTFTSNLNVNYTPSQVWTVTGSFTFNRFANPQGTVRNNVNMNIGIQRKLLQKKLLITFNAIDPFLQQQNRTFTFGPNFQLESFSQTNTRNFRLTVSYVFNKSFTTKKKGPSAGELLKKTLEKNN